jgi:ubiquinone/menaquinone biosynthesis C-methylase UbiE
VRINIKKADYKEIAKFYDKGRSISEQNIDLWLELVSKYSRVSEGSRVLDLGCGTGRFTVPMAIKLGYKMTGADYSMEMLDKARGKDVKNIIKWDCMDAQYLTYDNASFDVIFMSHLLHHVDSPTRVISECKRVLRDPGVILIRYGAMELIRNDVEHTFFHETLVIDEPRTPDIDTIEKWLSDTGFSGIKTEVITQKTYESATTHLQAAAAKSTSVLTMIPQQAFENGIQRFSEYIEENPDNPWLQHDKIALTVGYNRKAG